jgi:pimeloyl-ACP methyl ester carboxylesterase
MPIVTANGIDIAYDEVGDKGRPAIVLIMGLGTQMISWPEVFCAGLADRGFRVIRFDNRDIGLSTKIETAPPVDLATAMVAGLIHDVPTVKELIDRIMADAERLILDRLAGFLGAETRAALKVA